MCGIAGIFGQSSDGLLEGQVNKMIMSLVHRGPDDSGIWINKDNTLALGHRRLTIIDLSKAGHQPMQSSCGTFGMSFNGEIYNQ